jgi:hypothetical protein
MTNTCMRRINSTSKPHDAHPNGGGGQCSPPPLPRLAPGSTALSVPQNAS